MDEDTFVANDNLPGIDKKKSPLRISMDRAEALVLRLAALNELSASTLDRLIGDPGCEEACGDDSRLEGALWQLNERLETALTHVDNLDRRLNRLSDLA